MKKVNAPSKTIYVLSVVIADAKAAAPQFEVGDTVRHILGDTGRILSFDWENDIRKQVLVLWESDGEECGCAARNLTLVSKAVKA